MIESIKAFFTKEGWQTNWKIYIAVVIYGAIAFVIGAFGGACIQFIKDILK